MHEQYMGNSQNRCRFSPHDIKKKKSQVQLFQGGNIQVYVTDALSDNRINSPPL